MKMKNDEPPHALQKCALPHCLFLSLFVPRLSIENLQENAHVCNKRLLVFFTDEKSRAIFHFDKVIGLERYLCFMHPHKWN